MDIRIVAHRGSYWFQQSDKEDHAGRVNLIDTNDTSTGILAYSKDIRVLTDAELHEIDYALPFERFVALNNLGSQKKSATR